MALEDSLKLVVQKTIEEGLGPLEQRMAALEAHVGIAPANGRVGAEKNESGETGV